MPYSPYNPVLFKGSTLVFSLLLLSVMSLLGLGAMQGAVLEEKMASNFRFGAATFHAAEAGLQQAIQNHTDNQFQSSFSGTIDSSQYSVTITESSGIYTAVSEATHTVSGSQRRLTLSYSGNAGTAPTINSWYSHE